MPHSKVTFSLSEPLEFTIYLTDIVFTAKPTYKFCFTVFLSSKSLFPAASLILELVSGSSARRSDRQAERATCKNVPQLQTETIKPLALSRLIFLHLYLGDLSIHIWFVVAPRLVVGILLGTSFIERFICKILLLDRNLL